MSRAEFRDKSESLECSEFSEDSGDFLGGYNSGGGAAAPMHHSDRGVQYACKDYTDILKRRHMRISMTENGNPGKKTAFALPDGTVNPIQE